MGARASRAREQLAAIGNVTTEAHAEFLKAEDGLAGIEDREQRRENRKRKQREDMAARYPALRGGGR